MTPYTISGSGGSHRRVFHERRSCPNLANANNVRPKTREIVGLMGLKPCQYCAGPSS